MNDLIGYCGLNCEKCDAYIATVNNDNGLREKTAKRWSELNKVLILPENINCDGCRMNGKKTVYCESLCVIRQCALKNCVHTCGSCRKMENCEKLEMIFSNNADAKKNLIGNK